MTHKIRRAVYPLLALLLLAAGWFAAGAQHASAAGAASGAAASSTGAAPIDAVLVLDASNSMAKSDPQKIGNEAMRLFIDMLPVRGDRVGIVSYTDVVQREKALLKIESQADKDELKTFIGQLGRGAYTDTAVGITEAVNMLSRSAQSGTEPMIVLLADGNTELNSTKTKTLDQSEQELAASVQKAKDAGIPIYTIGLNADGKLNQAELEKLSSETSGKSFVTTSADELPEILSEIFASHQQLNVVPVDSLTGTGDFQDVTISVPNANVMEANVSITSSKKVEVKLKDPSGAAVPIPSDAVALSTSKTYSLVKMIRPQEGDWTLSVKGADKDQIDINLVFNYDLELAVDPLPASSYGKGDAVPVSAYLVSGGQPLSSPELYKTMQATLVARDEDTGSETTVPMTLSGDKFEVSYELPDAHKYTLTARAEADSFYREAPPISIDAASGAAAGGSEAKADKPFPLIPVILGVLGLLVLAAIVFFLMRYLKKANKGFVGQMVIEIRDENTGERSYPQYKKLNTYKGRFNLHQLLQLAPELKETENIVFTPGSEDRIVLRSSADGIPIEKSGRVVDATRGAELKSGDRITVPVNQVGKTILVEYLV
ncbi:vWA domain-containing protein [Saccharibacillus sp. CPCC 101409]|uniref:vWA domain-containing protein n=1 Tax=Saccharibacillus sp. CPCC 101409 TaxID=3058041 RepID=UPI0026730B82|nr:vWA domain-containing protein [Saccharibacillus sp. CPCC 101409]MDO3412736.1 vWA domain-containing protein [Saccharibacillus sp. CPCC 101409]